MISIYTGTDGWMRRGCNNGLPPPPPPAPPPDWKVPLRSTILLSAWAIGLFFGGAFLIESGTWETIVSPIAFFVVCVVVFVVPIVTPVVVWWFIGSAIVSALTAIVEEGVRRSRR